MSFNTSDKAKILKGTLINVVGGTSLAVFKIFTFLLRGIIGGEAFGIFIIAYSFMEIVSLFILGGFNDGITYFTAQYLHKPDKESHKELTARELKLYQGICTAFFIPLLMSVLVAIVVQFTIPFIYTLVWASYDKSIVTVIQTLIWGLPLLVLMQQPAVATKAHLDMKWFVLVTQISQPMLSIIFALLLHYYFGLGVMSMVYGIIISLILNLPLSIYGYTRYFSISKTLQALVNFKLDKKMLSFAFPQSFNMMLNTGLVKFDALMLSAFVSANAVGIYSLISGLTQLIRITKMAFSEVFAPLVAKYKAQNNRMGLIESLHNITRFTSFLSIPLLFIVMTFYPEFILAKGEHWDNPQIYPWLLVLGPLMSTFFGLAGNLLLMMGHSKLLLFNSFIASGLNIFLNFLFIPAWGVLGAALATAISNVAISVLQIIELAKLEQITFKLSLYKKTIISTILVIPLIVLLNTEWLLSLSTSLGTSDFVIKLIGLVISIFFFCSLVLAWPGVNQERKWVLQKIFKVSF